MDFDIGSLVYILLTLLFIIIGSLGGRKKSKQVLQDAKSNSESSSGAESHPLSDNLRKIFGDFTASEKNINKYADESDESEDYLLDSPEDRIDNAKDFLEKPGNEIGSDKIFTSFGSAEPLKILGNFKSTIELGGKAVSAKFYVADVAEKSLLGAETAQELGILQFGNQVSKVHRVKEADKEHAF